MHVTRKGKVEFEPRKEFLVPNDGSIRSAAHGDLPKFVVHILGTVPFPLERGRLRTKPYIKTEF
jgi:hypothetical protein